MGTGIVSILLHTLPWDGRWLYWISVGIFGVNVLLFRHHPSNDIFTVRPLSGHLPSHDQPSYPVAFSRYIPNGFCHDHKHALFCLCAIVGTWSGYLLEGLWMLLYFWRVLGFHLLCKLKWSRRVIFYDNP
jgi:hypothetical protein